MRHIKYWQCDSDAGCGCQFDTPTKSEEHGFVSCPECGSQVVWPIYGDMGKPKKKRKGKSNQLRLFEKEA